MDQSNPQVLWTGGGRPWRTTNGATLWEAAGPNFTGVDQISAIAVAPSDGNVVYLGYTSGHVARTTNALDPSPSWSVMGVPVSGGWVSSVAVDPQDPDIAYCTYSNYGIPHVWRTVNGGTDWTSIDGIAATGVPDIPVHWVAVRPCNPEQLYAGTELGVFASDDSGATWDPVNDGLANTVVESLDFQNNNTLVAFSHGRGAFRTSLEPCPGDCGERNGDLNMDGRVNLSDFSTFSVCFTGPGGPVAPECECADLNADGDVDLSDFNTFAVNFTG
jgi:hypothetical protein